MPLKRVLVVANVESEELVREQITKQILPPGIVPEDVLPFDFLILTDKKPAVGIEARRTRIAELQTDLQAEVANHLDYNELEPENVLVWQLEGDSVVPEDALAILIRRFLKNENAVYSGVQIGRHGLYCIGAWHITNDDTVLESVDHRLKGTQVVAGMGMYCYVVRADYFIKARCWWNGERWGPDVNWFRSMPLPKLVDMDLHIGHYYKGGIIEVDSLATCNARFTKIKDDWIFEQLD